MKHGQSKTHIVIINQDNFEKEKSFLNAFDTAELSLGWITYIR